MEELQTFTLQKLQIKDCKISKVCLSFGHFELQNLRNEFGRPAIFNLQYQQFPFCSTSNFQFAILTKLFCSTNNNFTVQVTIHNSPFDHYQIAIYTR